MTIDEIIQKAEIIPSFILTKEEKILLCRLAAAVPARGRIVEVGSCYGGSTALLSLSNPEARITAIDNFSWSPIPGQPASRERLEENLSSLEIHNVKIIEEDSLKAGPAWNKPIDLLWIDGGHSYEFFSSDLLHFGAWATVIAAHDYGNPTWPSIRQAVEDFKFVNQFWRIDAVVDSIVVLRRFG